MFDHASDLTAAEALIALIAGWIVLGALVFGRKSAGAFERVNRQGASPFLPGAVMTTGYRVLEPCARVLAREGISPNALSWLSLPPALASGVLAAVGLWGWAAWGLFASALLDVLDGAVARASSRTSKSGAILDSVLDRYSEFALLAGILVHFEHRIEAQVLVFAALSGGILVTYSTAKAEAMHLIPPRGWMKRSDRMACLVMGCLLSPLSEHWLEGGISGSSWHPWPILGALLAIALFGNVSAVLRFAALSRLARENEPS